METINTLTMKQCLAVLAITGRPDSLTPVAREETRKQIHAILNRIQTLISLSRNRVRLTSAQHNFIAAVSKDWAYGPHSPHVQF